MMTDGGGEECVAQVACVRGEEEEDQVEEEVFENERFQPFRWATHAHARTPAHHSLWHSTSAMAGRLAVACRWWEGRLHGSSMQVVGRQAPWQ